jgi:hypothetical protein
LNLKSESRPEAESWITKNLLKGSEKKHAKRKPLAGRMASDDDWDSDYNSDYEERPPKGGVPGFQFNPDTGSLPPPVLSHTLPEAATYLSSALTDV